MFFVDDLCIAKLFRSQSYHILKYDIMWRWTIHPNQNSIACQFGRFIWNTSSYACGCHLLQCCDSVIDCNLNASRCQESFAQCWLQVTIFETNKTMNNIELNMFVHLIITFIFGKLKSIQILNKRNIKFGWNINSCIFWNKRSFQILNNVDGCGAPTACISFTFDYSCP